MDGRLFSCDVENTIKWRPRSVVSWKVRVIFLLEPVIRELNGKRRNFGPGDILTLRYALNRHPSQALADLLAARSLISIKLIETEELPPGASPAPHAEGEIRVGRIVDQLSFDDCENLFNTIAYSIRMKLSSRS